MGWILIFSFFSQFPFTGKITPELIEKLARVFPDEKIQVIVHMKLQADLSILPDKTTKAEKLLYLQEFAETNQADLINYLNGFGSTTTIDQIWWIFNGFMFTATRDIIETVAAREDVDYVIDNFEIKLENDYCKYSDETGARTPEWNISKIMADSCWVAGYDGATIIVGNIDTGVDVDHPAFHNRWVPGGWYDAVNGESIPYDDNGHGTHVMGIICGGDGLGPFVDDIGVAPGAQFICAKAFNNLGGGQSSWIHNCLQWFSTQNAKIVNNSWGSASTTSLEYWNDFLNLKNLDIYPVCAIGGSGPGSGTACTPGNYPILIGVGSTDINDNVASFSSRGPAPNQNPWTDTTYWQRSDWNRIKPDIAAPGVIIRSCVPGGGYTSFSGTSPSCPHVAGGLAICVQKNAYLPLDDYYNILLDNADHPSQGAPYPNNIYGWGRLNVWRALQAVIGVEEQKKKDVKNNLVLPTIVKGPLHIPQNQKITVFDISGREVIPPYLTPGIYFIEIDKKTIQKIIVLK